MKHFSSRKFSLCQVYIQSISWQDLEIPTYDTSGYSIATPCEVTSSEVTSSETDEEMARRLQDELNRGVEPRLNV